MYPSLDAQTLEVFLLGLVDYQEVLSLQRRIVYELGDGGPASLLLCEHPPTISVGRAGSRAHMWRSTTMVYGRWESTLTGSTAAGAVSLHLPGQLAAYPVVPLQDSGLTLAGYLEGLHHAIVGVLDELTCPAR